MADTPDSFAGLMKRGYWERAIQVADHMALVALNRLRTGEWVDMQSSPLHETWAYDYWTEQGDRAWRAARLGYDDPKGHGWRVG